MTLWNISHTNFSIAKLWKNRIFKTFPQNIKWCLNFFFVYIWICFGDFGIEEDMIVEDFNNLTIAVRISSGKQSILWPQVADELASKWSKMVNVSSIPLTRDTSLYSVKAVLHTLFGNLIKNESDELDFRADADEVNIWLPLFICLFWCFTSKWTAMVMSGRSVHLTTLCSWAGLNKRLTRSSCTYIQWLETDNIPSLMNQWKGGKWPKNLLDQSLRMYGTGLRSNLQPVDLKSDWHL